MTKLNIKTSVLGSIVLISLLFIGLKSDTTSVVEEGIVFEHVDFKEAQELAKSQNKLIFMDAYTTWCGPCKLMAKTVFTEKEVGDFYNSNFINIKVDMETSEGMFLGKQYKVEGYPTFLYINSKGEVVHRTIGASDKNAFLANGKQAVKRK